jgi:hypothetical protein
MVTRYAHGSEKSFYRLQEQVFMPSELLNNEAKVLYHLIYDSTLGMHQQAIY